MWNRKPKLKRGITLLSFIFLLAGNVSAQKFGGLMWQHEILIVSVASALMILALLKPDIPILGGVSFIWFLYAAIAADKMIIYASDGTKIVLMDYYHLTYLFGFMAVFMLITTIYNYLTFTTRKLSGIDEGERGRIAGRF